MIIGRITTHILRAPIPERTFYSSQAAFPERNSLLVRVEVDNGLVGWGEGGQYGPPGPVASCINDVLAPLLLHGRADQPVRVWEELYARTSARAGRPGKGDRRLRGRRLRLPQNEGRPLA